MLSYAFLRKFRNALCVTPFFLCVTPFFERLSINGNSLDFGRLVEKIDDQRLARANGVVPNYFVVEP